MAKEYDLSDVIKERVYSDTVLSYVKGNVPEKQFLALKKGQIAREGTLDLFGLKIEEARVSLSKFIKIQAHHEARCFLIIHGTVGRHDTTPLVKNMVNCWLPQFKDVLAFYSAQTKDGGTGAVYVLLKKDSIKDLPKNLPSGRRDGSFLVAETKSMERNRRRAEQQGERQLARVNAREHSEEEVHHSPEGELQNTILQHPELDNQRFDGVDPNLNPEPPLNSEARREFDNEQREQEKEKQLRLGNMPKFNSAPTPRGP